MHVRYLLGPSGSGKTFQCVEEIRQQLLEGADGPPLLLIAPKQSTYLLERGLLEDDRLAGYTRLQILSFERLAFWAFQRLGRTPPPILDDEGRVMVLRGLLTRHRKQLRLFRASAHLAGFADQLSSALLDIQCSQIDAPDLRALAASSGISPGLAPKLLDLAVMLEKYTEWLKQHDLLDSGSLLDAARRVLAAAPGPGSDESKPRVWVDGFVEFSTQELDLLFEVVKGCTEATVTFCLDQALTVTASWLSSWFTPRKNFDQTRECFKRLPGCEASVQVLARVASTGRFAKNEALRCLETAWSDGQPPRNVPPASAAEAMQIYQCTDPETEALTAARQVLAHVHQGGRFRDICVLVRNLETYHEPLRRVFARCAIPVFLDRRESVAHHPMAELTRSALRTIAYDWQHSDWFAALKSGLVYSDDQAIDRLENEALARGWSGGRWRHAIVVPEEPELSAWLKSLQLKLVPPFERLGLALGPVGVRPDGTQLATALRRFWSELQVEAKLGDWARAQAVAGASQIAGSAHLTVWEQMNAWLANVELGFAGEGLTLRDWLPVLEAGLAKLSIGLIPPVLDQVLVGSVDRRRNPEVDLAIVLGLNEGVFPARPETASLLTESDRVQLLKVRSGVGRTTREHLAHERHLAYLAFTRARRRLVVTSSSQNARGAALNPSPFLKRIAQLFPASKPIHVSSTSETGEVLHRSEVLEALVSHVTRSGIQAVIGLGSPALSGMLSQVLRMAEPTPATGLSPAVARELFGPALRTSVSRMEQFGACPFRFFVHSGLRAEERKRFELDARERGSFQHDVLAAFHKELRQEGRRWRDLSPAEARDRIGRLVRQLAPGYSGGLLASNQQTRFALRLITASLQEFVATLILWMREQYRFDPVEVELPFGARTDSPPWTIPLAGGERLELHGRIDRVDLCRPTGGDEAYCVVVDYKSSAKQLDNLLVQHGIQLQLLAYLSVLRQWPNPQQLFGVKRLIPVGVFYVTLKGFYPRGRNRREALANPDSDRKLAFRHAGRFDLQALPFLDSRTGVNSGDQFNYRLKKDGSLYALCREPLKSEEFQELLAQVEANLKGMGEAIYAGSAAIDPFRKGSQSACDTCEYQPICRIDPATHTFRSLANQPEAGEQNREE